MRSLRKFILALTAFLVALLIAAAAALVVQAEASARDRVRAELLETTRALSQVVDTRLRGYQELLEALAASDAMRRGDLAEIDRQARAALQDPEAWIVLFGRDGRQLVNSRLLPGAPLPWGRLDPRVLRELDKGRTRVSDLIADRGDPHILCVDVPVMIDGRVRYHLSVVFRPQLLQRIIGDQRIPPNRIASVLDGSDRVIWRNSLPERFVGQTAVPALLSKLRTQPEGLAVIRSFEGVPSEVAFSRSQWSGWTFSIAVPVSELTAGAVRTLRVGVVIAGLFFALAVATAWYAATSVVEDLDKLRLGANRIRRGDPPAFEPSRFEEFGSVSTLLAEAIAERDSIRERFELAQEVGGVGAWEWHAARDEGWASDTFRRMHGLTHIRGPLKFAQVVNVVHPDDRARYLERLVAAARSAEPSTHEYRVVRPDGSICWVASKGRPVLDEAGRVTGGLGVVWDATAEHEAQDALRRLNELLERTVEERTLERDRLWNIARDPFVVTDAQGVWLAASPAWSAVLGYPLEEFLGRTAHWMEHPDDIARTRAEDRRLVEGQFTERFENRFRAKDGTYRWFSWTAVPDGRRFYGVARDVTEEKERAKALKVAEDALRQAQKMESIGQITGGVAHDFNNLLMPIIGTLDLLQQRGLPDARSERMVVNALDAAERARMLVQRLLAFARRQPLKSESLDLTASLEQMRPLLATTVGPQVDLRITTPSDLPFVTADSNQLELALLNLAVNAKDAMPDGGALFIFADLDDVAEDNPHGLASGSYVQIVVADTGVGMPQSVIERAVEPFFTTKGIGRGTGLGLSMVHGLMAQLGGGMQIDSVLGRGTTIRLWVRPTTEPPHAVRPRELPSAALPHLGRALLVDDEEIVRESAAQMLAALGYDVTEAASGDEALAVLATGDFRLLITDHLMPGMSGSELGREARDRWPALQILIISGYADVDDIAPDLPRLAKPFRKGELAAALARVGEGEAVA
ncbi:MAG TPA: PAS domain-containing protein [Caulobacteraceae bacterium]